MKTLSLRLLTACLLGTIALPTLALAEDEEPAAPAGRPEDELDKEMDPLGQDGLETRRPKEPVAVSDPDPGMADRIEARRREVETLVNGLQEDVNKPLELEARDAKAYDKLADTSGKLVEGFIAETEKTITARNTLLDEWRAADGAGKSADKEKAAKSLVKLREAYLKSLEKTTKAADKIRADLTKMQAKAAK